MSGLGTENAFVVLSEVNELLSNSATSAGGALHGVDHEDGAY
jgi:hypothetical protein